MKVCFYGYKVEALGQWGPENIKTGLPGSEGATVYLAKEFVSHGHDVTVFFDPKEEIDGIYGKWKCIDTYDPDEYFDLFIYLRNTPIIKINARRICTWHHDLFVEGNNWIGPEVHHMLILSKFHLSTFVASGGTTSGTVHIIGNGVVPSQFTKPKRSTNKYSIGYFSNYARGLNILLEVFPRIKKRFPEATLKVCYGRNTWYPMMEEYIEHLVKQMEDQGVEELGCLGHEELAEVMQTTSVWAYPMWNYTEVFCINAISCQMAGMIPCVNKLGGLNDTIHRSAPCFIEHATEKISDKFYDKLCEVLENIDKYDKERDKYIEHASKYTWEQVYKNIMDIPGISP